MKRLISAILCLVMMTGAFAILCTSSAGAVESTGYSWIDDFINDSRWTNGASWGSRQRPKTNPSARWYGCASYCYDYAKYCYGRSTPRAGTVFHNINEIRAGDVVTVGHESDGTGHWFVILKRSGNALYTAEGSWSGKVRIGWNYTISNGRFPEYNKSFNSGYHHINANVPTPTPGTVPVLFANMTEYNGISAYVEETDATVIHRITVAGGFSGSALEKIGIEWTDNSGAVMATKEETAERGENYVSFNTSLDLGITLTAETAYQYRFYGVYNGTAYYEEPVTVLTRQHRYSVTVVPPTATTRGYTLHTCAGCGDSYKTKYSAPLDGIPYGDVNGDGTVGKKDLLRLVRYLADNGTEIYPEASDVLADGVVNKKDSLRLKQYLAGWDVELGV